MARVIDIPPKGWIQSVTKLFSNSSVDCANLNTRQLGLSHATFIKAIKPNSEENQQKEFVFKVKHNDRVPFDAIGLEPSTRRWTGIELSEVIYLEPIIFGDNAIAQITMELGFASKADETDSALLCSSSIAREFRHLLLDAPLNMGQEVIFDFSGSNSRKRTAEQAFGLGYGALSPFTKTARVKLVASVKQIELRCKESDKPNENYAFGLLKDDSYVLLCPAPGSIIKLHGTNQISQWKPTEENKPVEEKPKQDEQPHSPAKSMVTAHDDSDESAEKKPETTLVSATTTTANTAATTNETGQTPIELEAVELPDSCKKTYYTCDLVLNTTDYDISKNGAHVCIDYTIADGTQKQFFAVAKNEEKNVKKGDVAMGSLHLKFTKIEVGQKVKVRAITEDEKKCKIEWMQAEAKLESSSLCSLFDSTQLADKYKSVFSNRFLNKDQSLACILSSFTRPKQSLFSESCSESYTFSFTPKEIRLKNTSTSTDACTCICGAKKDAQNSKAIVASQFGLFTRETKIELISSDTNNLDFFGDCYKKDDKIQPILKPDWDFSKMGIGGLDEQFGEIFRRAFASRMLPESVRNEMGIKHTRGLLLYGPPGTGKTLIARKIAGVLNAREPKIVRGPEIFSKWVGDSEKHIRELFSDAEGEYAALGEKSRLHVIIFDEFDAVCPNREFCNSGHRVEQKVVNQLLSAIDGVDQLNNILVIAMTNQKDQIDPAILRPGRIEIQIEIHLPDEAGRLQILNIHTEKMRENKRLDECVKLDELSRSTPNFSGAELEGLVRAAQSCALSRFVSVKNCSAENLEKEATDKLKITMADFEAALEKDVKPAFGNANDYVDQILANRRLIPWCAQIESALKKGEEAIKSTTTPDGSGFVRMLVTGPRHSGKSFLAATLAKQSKFSYLSILSPKTLALGNTRDSKMTPSEALKKTFDNAYKSNLSCVLIDNIEHLADYTEAREWWNNEFIQNLIEVLDHRPPKGKRLLVIATSSCKKFLEGVHVTHCFNEVVEVPEMTKLEQIMNVLNATAVFNEVQAKEIERSLSRITPNFELGIKRLLEVVDSAKGEDGDQRVAKLIGGLENTLTIRKHTHMYA